MAKKKWIVYYNDIALELNDAEYVQLRKLGGVDPNGAECRKLVTKFIKREKQRAGSNGA